MARTYASSRSHAEMMLLTRTLGWLLGLGLLGCLVLITVWSSVQLTRSLAELEASHHDTSSHGD